jgi:lipoprotein Spr
MMATRNIPALLWMCLLTGLIACHSQRKIAHHKAAPARPSLHTLAQGWVGTPYKFGGNDRRGIDCSGLVCRIYDSLYQIKLPRTSSQQYLSSTRINRNSLKEGDLLFFGKSPEKVSHVGIYLGNNQFVHASESKGVIISKMSESWYEKHFIGAGRPSTSGLQRQR